jgi:hypothetical protein
VILHLGRLLQEVLAYVCVDVVASVTFGPNDDWTHMAADIHLACGRPRHQLARGQVSVSLISLPNVGLQSIDHETHVVKASYGRGLISQKLSDIAHLGVPRQVKPPIA